MIRNGPTRHISALTFDFWNTLYSADNGSLDGVRPQRKQALRQILAACGVSATEDTLGEAYQLSFDAYMRAWKRGLHFGAREQVMFVLDHFGVVPASVDIALIDETALAIEDASLTASLRLLTGARETVPQLAAAGYTLGVISDTSLTPGRILRQFLKKDGLLECFTALTFSDVTGYTKPDRRMFEQTLGTMGAEPRETAHVGDTPRTDIGGAQALGMIAIRYASAADHEDPPVADFVIKDHREIPAIIRSLEGQPG